ITHDFNNLLGVLAGYSELLLTGPEEPELTRGYAEEICRAAGRAAELTRQLLHFSRPRPPFPQRLDLGALVQGMEKLLRRLLGEQIDVIVETRPGLGAVLADPGQLFHVV